MSEFILISIAWPYANAEIHVGNITGSHLPGDIVARYHRLKGNRVLVVSGTDAHGTPVTLAADKEGQPVEAVYKKYHDGFLELFKGYGITYDLFTTTHTENHARVTQAIFLALKENGFLYTAKSMQWYSPSTSRFLPDRYVEGTCYICGFEGARSDQCDQCGNVLEPEKLKNPRSKEGGALELRETEHFYLDLSKLEPNVKDFLRAREGYWRDTVIGESLRKIESEGEGLKPRAITRDLDWGVPIPVEGWTEAGKRIYVWFEAVIGYLSAAIEWAQVSGQPEAWRQWWVNPQARQFYFIGKDNIFFHAAWWPAQLMGVGNNFLKIFARDDQPLTLPYDVPANQFMNLERKKISGSRNWAVWGADALRAYDPDALRYYLTANMPEQKDSDWDWAEFVARNNNELVATWGNLANRVLTFAYKHWEGHAPDPGNLRPQDHEILAKVEAGFKSVGELLETVKLRAALAEAVSIASEVNRYLDVQGPWFEIKRDRAEAAKTIFTALKAIDSLKTLFAPFLPFSSEKLHSYFGYEGALFGSQKIIECPDATMPHTALTYDSTGALGQWAPSQLQPGQALRQPNALFKKLEPKVAEEERARLGQPTA